MPKRDDDRLHLRISNRLNNVGIRAPCRIILEVYDGDVTIKGVVQFEYQKKAAITTIRAMEGVHHICDQLKVEPPVKAWDGVEDRPPAPPTPPAAEEQA